MRHALCIICEEMSKDKRIEVLKFKDKSNSEIKGKNVRLISQPISPTACWALVTRPDRERPTLHGWWASVALRYIKRWGADGSRYEVHREPYSHRQTLIPISKRARSQRREAATVITVIPSSLHCYAPSTLHRRPCNLYSTRRCPCAASITEPAMASTTATSSGGSGSSPALSPLSTSRCSVIGLNVHVFHGSMSSSA